MTTILAALYGWQAVAAERMVLSIAPNEGGTMRKTIAFTIFVAAWLAGEAVAGPDATANRFLNDTPSMMDFGALRLENYLQDIDGFEEIAVHYSWDRNRVVISRVLVLDNSDQTDLEENCRSWTQSLRSEALVFEGNLVNGMEYSEFAEFFGHIGFQRTISGVTEIEALRELDRMFLLETRFWRHDESGWSATLEMTCFGELLGTGFSVSRE
ncbi:hypothetical protein [Pelagibacterium halotolerans]|uniref:hypothetical protein n=1 Tax=Pelagibacterium halotolerans TaxID=531813 RepID=UPI00384D89A0